MNGHIQWWEMSTEKQLKTAPYTCHVFVCVNDRKGKQQSCADGNSVQIRLRLKEEATKKWPSGIVRVSQSLCMGLCQYGPNVMIYPHNIWFSAVKPDDVDSIINEIERLLQKNI
jgi:(2Fe-2S) ferredoxin